MTALAWILISLSSMWAVLGLVAVRWTIKRPHVMSHLDQPGISVLKPLCGADPALSENLQSFFEQDYANMELLFGVVDARDPAIPIAEGMCRRYPHVRARIIVHAGGRALNPKVANLVGLLPEATHDLLLVSDSNIRAPRDYLATAAATFMASPDTGLVTNLCAGADERSLGAALQNIQLNGVAAAGVALPTVVGDALVIGKSMLMSRAQFDALGGFARVSDILAEDFVIGKMVQYAGLSVRIAPTVLLNVTQGMSVTAFVARELRWATLRKRLRPWARWLELVASPFAMIPFAWIAMGPTSAIAWSLGVLWIRDVGGWLLLRGSRRAWIPLFCSPLREASMLAVWVAATFKQHIAWRGHRVRVGAGTIAFAEADVRGHGACRVGP